MTSAPQPVRVIVRDETQLVIVGVGGTGGYVLQQAARLLYGLKAQGQPVPPLLLIDGDTVEEKNLLRQYFLPQDVGRKKADVLAERYGTAYGLDIGSYPHYVNEETMLVPPQRSRSRSFVEAREGGTLLEEGCVVVGCVDNAATRRVLHERLGAMDHVVYVDSGNSAATPPEDPEHVDRYQLAAWRSRGWEGQVVAGVRYDGRWIVPFAGEVFPDLLEVLGDEDKIPGDPSCQVVAQSNPQRLMTNLMAATAVMGYLHPLIAEGVLLHHRTLFDARAGWIRSDSAVDAMLEVSA